MKNRFKTIAIFLLLSVAFSHVSFAQDYGDLKPLFNSVTIENQIPAPVTVAAEEITTFEAQPNQTSLSEIQYVEAMQAVKSQECIADADYGNCVTCTNEIYARNIQLNIKSPILYLYAIKPITHSSGGMPFRLA